jgi:hypothetical protein
MTKLRIGDRIRILSVLGAGNKNYTIPPETKRAYRKLIARRRSVRICKIDEYGHPWFSFRFKGKDATWEHHWMVIFPEGGNWVPVKHRQSKIIAD